MKLKKEYLLHIMMLWIIGTCIVGYIAGGIVYAIDIYILESRRMSLLVVLGSALVTLCVVLVGFKKYNWDDSISRINKQYLEEQKRQFINRYNITKKELYIIAGLLVVGFILRVIGYNWGLVGSWQSDECKLVNPAITMAERKVLYSDYYYYPAQFVSKIVAVILFPYARIKGIDLNIDTMAEGYFVFRIVVALFGTFTIYLAYLIGNYIREKLGVIFAFLVTVFPYYVCFSKQVTGDITALCFLAITLLYTQRYLEKFEKKYIVIMTMGAAMATLEKWHGAIGIGFIGVIMLLNIRNIKKLFSDGILALITYFAWLFLLAPNMMLHLKSAIVDGFINIAVYDNAEGAPYWVLLEKYIAYGFDYVAGIIYIAFIVLGVVYIVKNRSRKNYVLLLGVLKTVILCFMNRQYSRWGQELYFTELLLAAMGIYLVSKSASKYIKAIGYIGLAAIGIEFITGTILVVLVAASSMKDTRIIQRQKCRDLGITPSNCASQYYSGFSAASWCDKEYPNVAEKITDWNKYITKKDGQLYRANNIEYVVLNISRYDEEYEKIISEGCTKIFDLDAVCGDTFRIPLEDTDVTVWDWKIVAQDISLIKSVVQGEMIGDDIAVYYVGNLPVCE